MIFKKKIKDAIVVLLYINMTKLIEYDWERKNQVDYSQKLNIGRTSIQMDA